MNSQKFTSVVDTEFASPTTLWHFDQKQFRWRSVVSMKKVRCRSGCN